MGYGSTLISALVPGMGFIFIVFFSVHIELLLVGEVLIGEVPTAIVWGAFQTPALLYYVSI
jgi:SP family general alpha glucoside:H+ symporter-like MFS transporter